MVDVQSKLVHCFNQFICQKNFVFSSGRLVENQVHHFPKTSKGPTNIIPLWTGVQLSDKPASYSLAPVHSPTWNLHLQQVWFIIAACSYWHHSSLLWGDCSLSSTCAFCCAQNNSSLFPQMISHWCQRGNIVHNVENTNCNCSIHTAFLGQLQKGKKGQLQLDSVTILAISAPHSKMETTLPKVSMVWHQLGILYPMLLGKNSKI